MTNLTNRPWHMKAFDTDITLPPILHQIVVKDWSTGLIGDYRGCVVAYIVGGYVNDVDTLAIAAQNAEFIASAPTRIEQLEREKQELLAQVDKLKQENKKLKRRLNREEDFSDFLQEKYSGESESWY